ncbi:hypothetical protein PGRAN_11481 [Listeria grandensis FSL F6-0971]|uniref:Bacterial Ig domain-containing protein n=1 Tax=Listeria grandensis FSL F6-0971 TaxID=1265819 RepID=W7BRF3_9LIST|nr:hypothetical protein [Listeria grandensis]EUJ22828.1 hypothetical protein PGRAN_11481 [Listeria grandensis FSL F6-0971]
MIKLAFIFIFLGILTFFAKKTSFKKGMPLFLAIGMVAIILAGCSASDDELTKEEPTATQEKAPKLSIKSEGTFQSDENGTVTISGKTKPTAELTLVATGQPDQTTTSDAKGNFSFALTEVPNDGTATLTTTWKSQNETKNITYQANPAYKAKLAKIEQEKQVAEAKRIEAEKKEQERLVAEAAKAKREENARIAEENRKAEAKRIADQQAAAQKAREAAAQKEAEQRRQAATEQQPADNQGEMVYITATGKRYHFNQNCRGLNNSNGETQVTLSDAQSRGLTKCKFE